MYTYSHHAPDPYDFQKTYVTHTNSTATPRGIGVSTPFGSYINGRDQQQEYNNNNNVVVSEDADGNLVTRVYVDNVDNDPNQNIRSAREYDVTMGTSGGTHTVHHHIPQSYSYTHDRLYNTGPELNLNFERAVPVSAPPVPGRVGPTHPNPGTIPLRSPRDNGHVYAFEHGGGSDANGENGERASKLRKAAREVQTEIEKMNEKKMHLVKGEADCTKEREELLKEYFLGSFLGCLSFFAERGPGPWQIFAL